VLVYSLLFGLEDRTVPSTLTVTNLLDSSTPPPGSLRYELNQVQPADTIVFQSGLQGPIALGSPLTLSKSVTIQGNLNARGQPLITLDGHQQVQDIIVNQGVTASLWAWPSPTATSRPARPSAGRASRTWAP
jgi:hypothetical protein